MRSEGGNIWVCLILEDFFSLMGESWSVVERLSGIRVRCRGNLEKMRKRERKMGLNFQIYNLYVTTCYWKSEF